MPPSEVVAYQTPSAAVYATCTVPSSPTTVAVPFVFFCVRSRFSGTSGPKAMLTPFGGASAMTTAPRSKTWSAVRLASRTPGTFGTPIGRGTTIWPSTTSCGKPKYEMNGAPSASTAMEDPRPTLSLASATAGTNRSPCP